MHDVDEQWLGRLRGRIDGVAPDVAVDVDDALQVGRRRRTARRLAGAGGALGVVAALAVGVPALTGMPEDGRAVVAEPTPSAKPRPGDAAILDAADCFADEVLAQAGLYEEALAWTGLADVVAARRTGPAPVAGAVPDGFEAVAAVQCRIAFSRPHPLAPAVYEEVRLEGDIAALVAALALPPQAPESQADTICDASFVPTPVLYLVAADGRAVRPTFPHGACHPRPEPLAAVAALKPVEVISYEGSFDAYDDQQLQEGIGIVSRALHDSGLPWSAVRPAPDKAGLVVVGPGWATRYGRPGDVDALLDATLPGVPITYASGELDPGSRPWDMTATDGYWIMDVTRPDRNGGTGPAGETVQITYPEGTPRGAGYVLERFVGGWYQAEYLLTAVPAGSGLEPGWATLEEGATWDDVVTTGPGPDLLRIPESADGEYYRLCTANAPQNLCTQLF